MSNIKTTKTTKTKKFLKTNVYKEALSRLKFIFNEFRTIQISFSGGKDSGVLLELVLEYIKEYKPSNNIVLYTLDYEAGYEQTVEYVNYMIEKCKDYMEIYNVCLPIKAQNAVSINKDYWRPWDYNQKEIWVRELPKNAVHDKNNDFDFDYKKLTDYEFNAKFSEYISKKYKSEVAVLVGVRADESLNRQRIFYNDKNKYKSKKYSTLLFEEPYISYAFYPIYDWEVKSIWKYNALKKVKYNSLYDLMYYANVPVSMMRVASPFNDCAVNSLKLFKSINPTMWGKMIGRVEGVNTAAIYGDTSVYGWKDIKLPKNHTWETYTNFLLGTLDESTRNKYLEKFNKSIEFWKTKGAALNEETVQELKRVKMKFTNHGPINKTSNKDVITFEYYPDELKIKNWRAIGSWKRFSVAILKNDISCKTLGFSPNKEQNDIRKDTEKMLKQFNKEEK